jgi:hypothetical protein
MEEWKLQFGKDQALELTDPDANPNPEEPA